MSNLQDKRILVVEDDPANATLLETMLKRLGYGCRTCSTGAGALAALRAERFDLTLMDIRLPDISGVIATKMIRETLGITNRQMPIIAITAFWTPQEVTAFLEAGMDDFVRKPLAMAQLGHVLNQWLTGDGGNFDSFDWGLDTVYDNPKDLDLEALENFMGFVGPAKMRELFMQFQRDYVYRMQLLQDKPASAQSLKSILHPLIATSASLGMTRLSAYCREIMMLCHADGFTPPPDLAAKLQDYYEAGATALKSHIGMG